MKRSRHLWTSRPIALALTLVLTLILPLQNSDAGDGTISPNFSIQLNTEGGFAPQISVPPQDDNYSATLVMAPCLGPIKNDCIVSVEYTDAQGKWLKGTFKELTPLKNLAWSSEKFKADYNSQNENVFAKAIPSLNFPAGGRTGIWTLPGARHDGGSDYALTLVSPGAASNTSNPRAEGSVITWSPNDGFRLTLVPIFYDAKSSRTSCHGAFGNASFNCAYTTTHRFPPRTKFRVSANFKVTKSLVEISQWYAGRIINSQLDQVTNSDGSILFSVQGSPTVVGTVQTEFEKNDANYEVVRQAYEIYSELTFGSKTAIKISPEGFRQAQGSSLSTESPGTTAAWRILEEKFEFKYLSEDEVWQMGTTTRMADSDRRLLRDCGASNFLPGIITTNAVAANPSPPKWNPETRELTYTIASPHTRKDGTVNVGFYELSMDKRIAECLWGNDPLQYRASISVTSPDGTQKTSTTLFAVSDKYLSFRAAGFSYSTSLIRVKLTKGQGSEASKSGLPDLFLDTGKKSQASGTNTTPKSSVASSTKKTITCAKGKSQTKVSGANPKCPKGYKRVF